MKPIQLLFSALTFFICTASMAQYQWIDGNGRKVFSDQPPPASVPAQKIMQQPSKNAASATPAAAEEPAAGANSAQTTNAENKPAAKKEATGKDKELEAKKKQADAELAAKKKIDEEKQAKANADNCERAKGVKAGLNSGARISQYNAKGERVVMDEAARMVETKRIEGIIQTDCK